MRIEDFVAVMEELAPPERALAFDNVGLLIGPEKREIKRVLVALDCTAQTALEAAEAGAQLLLTHHPVFFHGVKHILPDDPDTAGAYTLIRNGVGLYAAHTNLDAAAGGVNDALAEAIGVTGVELLPPENLGRIGQLAESVELREYARRIEASLHAVVRVCGDGGRQITRVALVGGAGGDAVLDAARAGADALVTGECNHHHALAAMQLGLCVIEAGHYETERVVLPKLIERLQRRTNDVQYSLTLLERACLGGM